MPLSYSNLDADTRRLMLEEIDLDIAAGRLYLSGWLNLAGQSAFPGLLRRAAEDQDDEWLAGQLRDGDRLATGVEATAAQILAEGEFNRFYMRALCRRAIDEGKKLEVYRVKPPEVPRASLPGRVGQMIEPKVLLSRLRAGGWSSSLLKPGAGLSVKLC